jgi:uncharacterized iron-regulated protein
MKKIFIVILAFTSATSHSKITEIYKTSDKSTLSLEELIQEIPSSGQYILGEFHNTKEIQDAQGQLIHEKVLFEKAQNGFSVFWEFLNYTDEEKTQINWDLFKTNQIDSTQFITNTAGAQNLSYSPIFETTKTLLGDIKGINLPRAIKQKILKEGIQSIDPKYIPQNHYVGGPEYKERFEIAMGGHAPQDVIEKYFLVQCLTDSVMAEKISINDKHSMNFIIAGSFHTDFYDATVIRLRKLVNYDIITFKFVTKNNISAEELDNFKTGDKKYGAFADYIVITE